MSSTIHDRAAAGRAQISRRRFLAATGAALGTSLAVPTIIPASALGADGIQPIEEPPVGDCSLAEAKRRIGQRVCMIGGFDQFHGFNGCTPGDTRRAVREAFDAAGGGGGFILAPSDHFFEAEEALLHAFADEARSCRY